ncbi:MAG: hypothetical protein KC561_03450 [Myxococcales bacterium]|nr:hypothetical protein [Myxococcales bacterium]
MIRHRSFAKIASPTLAILFIGTFGCGEEATNEPNPSEADVAGGQDASSTDAAEVQQDPNAYWSSALTCEPSEARCADFGSERPGRLSEHAAAFDHDHEVMVVFGGSSAIPQNCGFPESNFSAETWLYDAACQGWQSVSGPMPGPRGRHMMTYGGGHVWLFGGRYRAQGESGAYTLYNDLWTFDVESGSWEEMTPQNAPSPRVNSVFVYDHQRDRIWLIAGNSSTSGASYQPLSEVWYYSVAENLWVQEGGATGPSPRLFAAGFLDYQRDRIVIFGGADESAFSNTARYMNDTWSLDLESVTWTELNDGDGSAPQGRFWGQMVHDTDADRYVLFAGHDDASLGNRNDLWTMNPETGSWSVISQGDSLNAPANGFCDFPDDFTIIVPELPERRNAHTMVWAPSCGGAIVFGGKTDCGSANDVWTYSDNTFEESLTAEVGEVCHRWRDNPDNCVSMCL